MPIQPQAGSHLSTFQVQFCSPMNTPSVQRRLQHHWASHWRQIQQSQQHPKWPFGQTVVSLPRPVGRAAWVMLKAVRVVVLLTTVQAATLLLPVERAALASRILEGRLIAVLAALLRMVQDFLVGQGAQVKTGRERKKTAAVELLRKAQVVVLPTEELAAEH